MIPRVGTLSWRRRIAHLKRVIAAFALLNAVASGFGQVTLDGSFSTAGGRPLVGPDFQILETDGLRRGANLFHSFGDFNLSAAESATFTGADSIQNVLSRVTGTNPSSIDGKIISEIQEADFFFMNPNGTMFGPNAELDIHGAFTVTTADSISLTDDGIFAATPSTSDLSLTSSPIASFGFLGTHEPAEVSFEGSKITMDSGEAFNVIAGEVTLTDETHITAPSGEVNIVSAAPSETVSFDGTRPITNPAAIHDRSASSLKVTDSTIKTTGNGGGRVFIRGGKVIIENSQVLSEGVEQSEGGKIQISGHEVTLSEETHLNVSGESGGGEIAIGGGPLGKEDRVPPNTESTIIEAGATLQADAIDAGDGGEVIIWADDSTYLHGDIYARALGESGNGGFAKVSGQDSLYLDDLAGQIDLSAANGTAGSLLLDHPNITITNGTNAGVTGAIITDTAISKALAGMSLTLSTSGTGAEEGNILLRGFEDPADAANITWNTPYQLSLHADNDFTMNSGGLLNSSGGGAIDIMAGRAITIDNQALINSSSSIGGRIDFAGADMFMYGNIRSNSRTVPDHAATEVTGNGIGINLTGDLTIGHNGDFSKIDSNAFGNVKGVNIDINVDNFKMIGGSIAAATTGIANGGSINVSAPTITLTGVDGEISTSSEGTGNAGTIALNGPEGSEADRITIIDGASVQSTTHDGEEGGAIQLLSRKIEVLRGAEVSTLTDGSGDGGNIQMETDILTVKESLNGSQATLTAESIGSGKGGNLDLNVSTLKIGEGGLVTTASNAINAGDAGEITITAGDAVEISGEITSATKGTGHGGSIDISAPTITLTGQDGKISTSSDGTGDAGTIALNGLESSEADRITITDGASIRSETKDGGGGTITLLAKMVNILKGAELHTQTTGSGKGGDIDVTTNQLVVKESLNGSQATITTESIGSGKGGNLDLNLSTLEIGEGGLVTTASNAINAGDAGEITITSDDTIEISGEITSATKGTGHGGSINVTAPKLAINQSGQVTTASTNNDQAEAGNAGMIAVILEKLLDLKGKITSDTDGTGHGGSIAVSAGTIAITGQDGKISTRSEGTGDAGTIALNGPESSEADRITITDGASIHSETKDGSGGTITLLAKMVNLLKGAELHTQTTGSGKGGDIDVTTGQLVVKESLNGSQATITAESIGSGKGGNLDLNLSTLEIGEGGLVTTASNAINAGDAGEITITSDDTIEISGEITSATKGTGHGGSINVTAPKLAINESGQMTTASTNTDQAEAGDAGMIAVISEKLLDLKGKITSGTDGSGHGGSIAVSAGTIAISGQDGKITTSSDGTGDAGTIALNGPNRSKAARITITDGASIHSETKDGGGGTITLLAKMVNLLKGAELHTQTTGSGKGGDIDVTTDQLVVKESLNGSQAIITAESIGSGKGGNLDLNLSTLEIGEGGLVTTASNAINAGNAGEITITSDDAIEISGEITSATKGTGHGGSINVTTPKLAINESGQMTTASTNTDQAEAGDAGMIAVISEKLLDLKGKITSGTDGSGHGGSIAVSAGTIAISGQDGKITTSSEGTGDAGEITITAGDAVEISGEVTSATKRSGNGGSIDISTPTIALTGVHGKISTRSEGTGDAGTIALNGPESSEADRISITDGASIHSETKDGSGGTIILKADHITVVSENKSPTISSATHGTANGGTIEISGGDFTLSDDDGSGYGVTMSADTYGAGNAGGIIFDLSGALNIMAGGQIVSEAKPGSSGSGGDIRINNTADLRVDGGYLSDGMEITAGSIDNSSPFKTRIASDTFSTGDAGNFIIETIGKVEVINGGRITVSSCFEGDAGTIDINADSIKVSGKDSKIESNSIGYFTNEDGNLIEAETEGSGGKISLFANKIEIKDSASISAKTMGTGKGGDINLKAESIWIIGENKSPTISSATHGTANGGTIEISGGDFTLSDDDGSGYGVTMSADTYGAGNAGGIIFDLSGALNIMAGGQIVSEAKPGSSGSGGDIRINNTADLRVDGGYLSDGMEITAGSIDNSSPFKTRIASDTFSTGDAGNFIIETIGKVEVINGGRITVSSCFEGDAGTVDINADSIKVSGKDSKIESNSIGYFTSEDGNLIEAETEGSGGKISLFANKIEIKDSASISAKTMGTGKGGDINLKAESIWIIGENKSPTISSETRGTANGGTIEISGGDFTLGDDDGSGYGVTMSADTYGSGNAGEIIFNLTGDLNIMAGGQVLSEAKPGSSGSGGDITIKKAANFKVDGGYLWDGMEITAESIDNSSPFKTRIASDTFSTGDAGNFIIETIGKVEVINGGRITVSSCFEGDAGTIDINADSIKVSGKDSKIESNSIGYFTNEDGNLIEAETGTEGSGGKISLFANKIEIKDSASISAKTMGTGKGGDINLKSESIWIIGENKSPTISSETRGTANGGTIEISGGDFTLGDDDGSGYGVTMSADTYGSGNAGEIIFNLTGDLNIMAGGQVLSEAKPGSSGSGGDITIKKAANFKVDGGYLWDGMEITAESIDNSSPFKTRIASDTFSTGDAGNFIIEAIGKVEVINGGRITVSSCFEGDAGTIDINADSIKVSGKDSKIESNSIGYFTNEDGNEIEAETEGSGGIIDLNAKEITIIKGGKITAETKGTGNSGDVSVSADSLRIEGHGLDDENTGISAESSSSDIDAGSAGNVSVNATDSFDLLNGGTLRVSTADEGAADGGNVTVTTAELSLSKGAAIDASSGQNGGNVTVTADEISLSEGVAIDASAGQDGGNVMVTADEISLSDGVAIDASAGQDGGKVTITADEVSLSDGVAIDASAGQDGGKVTITADEVSLSDGAAIDSSAGRDGGKVTIKFANREVLQMTDGSQISATAGRDGGDVTLIGGPRSGVLLNHSQIEAKAKERTGGNIQVKTGFVFANESEITASSEKGADGVVSIDVLFDVSASTEPLDDDLGDDDEVEEGLDPSKVSEDHSTYRKGGRGGIPVNPTGYLPSSQLWDLPLDE